MSVFYSLDYICDFCGLEYLVTGLIPQMPPHWIGAQISITDKNGIVPESEDDAPYHHFCGRECFQSYIGSQHFREKILLIDRTQDDNDEEGDPPK